MILRIRLGKGRQIHRRQGKNRHVATAAGALLMPAALMAYALGLWRLASDMGMAGEFALSGILNHWQIWIGVGAALHLSSHILNRYASSGKMTVPPVLNLFPSRPPDPVREKSKAASAR